MLFLTNCTATTAIYTLSLHDALPIFFFKKRSNDDGALPLGKRFQAGGQPVALEDARLVLLERLLGDAVGLEQRPAPRRPAALVHHHYAAGAQHEGSEPLGLAQLPGPQALERHQEHLLHQVRRCMSIAQMTQTVEPHPWRETPAELCLGGCVEGICGSGDRPGKVGVLHGLRIMRNPMTRRCNDPGFRYTSSSLQPQNHLRENPMITNQVSGTNVYEIASGIFRINTPIDIPGGPQFNFNQYLVADDAPLLFHTGPRRMFPLVAEAIGRVLPLEKLRYVAFSHYEADECGSLNDFLAAAPQAEAVCSQVAAMVSVNDIATRPARPMVDGEVLELGRHRLRWLDTPHVPHGWECGFMMELETRTMLCGDLFTQGGPGTTPVTDGDILEPSEAFRKQMDYYAKHPPPPRPRSASRASSPPRSPASTGTTGTGAGAGAP